MFVRITFIAIAAALLGACATSDHISSRGNTSAGGTTTGGGDSTYYNYNSTTQRGYSESGDIPSQAPAGGVPQP